MKQKAIFKTVTTVVLAAVMLLSPVLASMTAQAATSELAAETLSETGGDEIRGYKSVSVSYRTGENNVSDTDKILYNPQFFAEDNQKISAEMAKCSVALATAVYSWNYIKPALDGMKFTYEGYGPNGTKGNWNRSHTVDDNDFVKYVIAEQTYTMDGEEDPSLLMIVAIQGTNGNHDWDSNFNIGTSQDHEGFYLAHDEIMTDIYNRLAEVSDTYDKNHIYILVTGHSRGAAVANIVAGELTYGYAYRTVQNFSNLVSQNNIFGYTFACPAVSKSSAVSQTDYHNIYNFNNPDDLVPLLPLEDWGYVRYGQTPEFSTLGFPNMRVNVGARFKTLFKRDYNGSPSAPGYVCAAVNNFIQNTGAANSIEAKMAFQALAWFMYSGENKTLRNFLETAGFFITDNVWELLWKFVQDYTSVGDVMDFIESLQQIYALAGDVQNCIEETTGMSGEEFAEWFENNRERVENFESVFHYNITSPGSFVELYELIISKYVLLYCGHEWNTLAIENVIQSAIELYLAMVDTNGHLLQSVSDPHYPTVYVYTINAMYLGYKGWYGFGGDFAGSANMTEDSTILTIGESCFQNSSAMVSLIMNDRVEYLGDFVCRDASGLTTLILSGSLTNIPKYAFYNCSSITGKVTIAESVESIGINAFYNCSGLTEIEVPAARIGDGKTQDGQTGPFSGCSGVAKVRLTGEGEMAQPNMYSSRTLTPWEYGNSNGVTVEIEEGITGISTQAFYNCSKLKTIYLPQSVTVIASKAFDGSGILDVYYFGLEEDRDGIEFNGNAKLLAATWHYSEWIEDENGWRFQYVDGTFPASTWKQIRGDWYYFDADGYRQTGWLKLSGSWYYLNQDGIRQTGWQVISGKTYYFDETGVMLTGWQELSGDRYFFENSGAMATGWKQLSGKWYYFGTTGVMQTGWQSISGKTYYFNAEGEMLTGWQTIDGKLYYFGAGGAMASGWQKIGDVWYYFNTSGLMQTGWQKISNKWYYFNASGIMQTGWQKINEKWYYFNASGAMQTGWREISNKWYYFESGGAMVTGWKTIGEKTYFFKSSGTMAANEWCGGWWLNANGTWTYPYKATWRKNAKGWWFGDESGWYAKNCTITIDGKSYTFDANGYMK